MVHLQQTDVDLNIAGMGLAKRDCVEECGITFASCTKNGQPVRGSCGRT
jgi:hypothetical protein